MTLMQSLPLGSSYGLSTQWLGLFSAWVEYIGIQAHATLEAPKICTRSVAATAILLSPTAQLADHGFTDTVAKLRCAF